MMRTKGILLLFLLTIIATAAFAQTVMHLDTLFNLAKQNFPLYKQQALIEEEAQLNMQNIKSNYKPQIDLNGRATYQTDVTSIDIDIPNIDLDLPSLSKDQYKINIELNQILYDGGITKSNLKLASLQGEAEISRNEVELYKLYEKVASLFFGHLLLEESAAALQSSKESLESKVKVLSSAVREGVARKNDLENLKAEMINLDARLMEIAYSKKSLVQSLEIICGIQFPNEFVLKHSESQFLEAEMYTRPEFNMLNKQKELLVAQSDLIGKTRLPRAIAFSQLGYGKPGLNMFSNEFDPYGLIGVGLSWNIYDWGNTKRSQSILALKQQSLELQKEVLTNNLDVATVKIKSELDKIQKLIDKEEEIITIRKKIVTRTESQLLNGTITSNQFVEDLNKLTLSTIRLSRLNVQLEQQLINYKIQTGKISE